MSRIDALKAIEAVRVDDYTDPLNTHDRQWERYMWPINGTGQCIRLNAAIRDNLVIVSGCGMEIKCWAEDVQEAANAIAAWTEKVYNSRSVRAQRYGKD